MLCPVCFNINIYNKNLKSTFYYPTGGVEMVQEYDLTTFYYKTGEVKTVGEFIDGKLSKNTYYHKNGEVKSVKKY